MTKLESNFLCMISKFRSEHYGTVAFDMFDFISKVYEDEFTEKYRGKMYYSFNTSKAIMIDSIIVDRSNELDSALKPNSSFWYHVYSSESGRKMLFHYTDIDKNCGEL